MLNKIKDDCDISFNADRIKFKVEKLINMYKLLFFKFNMMDSALYLVEEEINKSLESSNNCNFVTSFDKMLFDIEKIDIVFYKKLEKLKLNKFERIYITKE